MGTSADAVVISRPGTSATSGNGRNTVGSTPTGTTAIAARGTPTWSWMSRLADSETVMTRLRRGATFFCMRRKP